MSFYDSIKLEKGMYNVGGKSFTKVLEGMDPSENYKGTDLEGLDAYQRQLKRFNIKVSGAGCDTVEKFFSASDSAILFPEYISRAVGQGMKSADALSSIVAANTSTDGIDYRAITSSTDGSGSSVAEGTAMRNVNVATKSSLVSLVKHGRVFSSTYEALRFQNLDVVTVILKRIGVDIASELLSDAVKVLLLGDAKSGDPADVIKAAYGAQKPAEATLTYSHLLDLWGGLAPYNLNVMIASPKTIKDILGLAEMKDPIAGLDFQGTGNVVTPMGAKLIQSSEVEDNKALGFDRNCSLQMIQSGDVIVDYDKLIDRQLNRAGISVTAGFSRIFKDSVKVLDYNVTTE